MINKVGLLEIPSTTPHGSGFTQNTSMKRNFNPMCGWVLEILILTQIRTDISHRIFAYLGQKLTSIRTHAYIYYRKILSKRQNPLCTTFGPNHGVSVYLEFVQKNNKKNEKQKIFGLHLHAECITLCLDTSSQWRVCACVCACVTMHDGKCQHTVGTHACRTICWVCVYIGLLHATVQDFQGEGRVGVLRG